MANQSSSKALVVPASGESLEMASTFEDQINLLASPTPSQYIKQRKGRGGKTFDYVEFNYVVARLNATFCYDWDVDIVEQNIYEKSGQIATKVRLTVRFADSKDGKPGRVVSKTAWGGSEIKTSGDQIIDIADDLKSSQADATKKAASLLGLCWDVYSGLTNGKERPTEELEEEVVEGEEVEEPEESQDISDLATNPDKDAEEKKSIAEWVKDYLEKGTIDYKSFKTYLHVTEFKPERQFTGKQFGNVSLSEGNIEDLRFLKENIDKLVNHYIKSMKTDE
jgi:hypothetical protein